MVFVFDDRRMKMSTWNEPRDMWLVIAFQVGFYDSHKASIQPFCTQEMIQN